MVGVVHQTEQSQQGWVTFAPEEFAGQRSGRATRHILSAITEINDLLLSPESQHDLFNSIAQVCARTLDYPFVAILLFDDESQQAEIAGVSDPEAGLYTAGRGANRTSRQVFSLTELENAAWVQSVHRGLVCVTARPQEIVLPLASISRVRALVKRLKIIHGMAIPLFARGKLVGALQIGSRRAEYEPAERADLLTLAHHTALAVEMWRLHDRAEGRTAVLKRLHTLSQTITGILNLDILYQEIAGAAGRLAKIDFCTVNTLTPDLKGYKNHAAWGEGQRSELATGTRTVDIFTPDMVRRAFAGEPILVADLNAFPAARERLSHRRAGAVAVFPFRSEGKPIGFITVGRDAAGEWEEETVEILKELAEYVTVAFTNARRYAEATRQAAVQKALAESANAIARLDVQDVLTTIVSQAGKIVKLSRCNVFLLDPTTATLRWAAGIDAPPEIQAEIFPVNEGLMGHVFATGEPVLVDDIAVDPRTSARHLLSVTGTRAFICVPLRWGADTMGVLTATHQEVGVFTRHDLELIATFADYATIALSNARLYSSLQQREEERSFLLRQVMTGQEAERRRVAVDIHDGPLQSIGVNILAVDRIRKLMDMGRAQEAMSELVQVREGMSAVIQELRDVINDLRPVVLENLGLVAATGAQLSHFSEQTGIRTHLEENLDGYRLPGQTEVIFFRLLQEALTNVRKHANAASLWLTFHMADGIFRMSITDNGIGFNPKSVVRSLESGHIGLHSMQERIEAIGGGMELDSTPGQGTRITFWVRI
jgi:signal transduction histidine kinase